MTWFCCAKVPVPARQRGDVFSFFIGYSPPPLPVGSVEITSTTPAPRQEISTLSTGNLPPRMARAWRGPGDEVAQGRTRPDRTPSWPSAPTGAAPRVGAARPMAPPRQRSARGAVAATGCGRGGCGPERRRRGRDRGGGGASAYCLPLCWVSLSLLDHPLRGPTGRGPCPAQGRRTHTRARAIQARQTRAETERRPAQRMADRMQPPSRMEVAERQREEPDRADHCDSGTAVGLAPARAAAWRARGRKRTGEQPSTARPLPRWGRGATRTVLPRANCYGGKGVGVAAPKRDPKSRHALGRRGARRADAP